MEWSIRRQAIIIGHNMAMVSLSRIDRLAAQLRVQLERQGKRPGGITASGSGKGGRAAPLAGSAQSPAALIRTLHAAGVTDERVLVGCLVESLLKQELGEELGNAAQFQQTVGMVVETLAESAETWALCRGCVAQALGAR